MTRVQVVVLQLAGAFHGAGDWLEEASKGWVYVGPIALCTRERQKTAMVSAFELGMDAGPRAAGIQPTTRPMPPTVRHLHLTR